MSLRLKIMLGIGAIETVLLVVLIAIVLNHMRVSIEENLENYVSTTSVLFATTTKDAVLSFDLASLEDFVEEVMSNESLLYTRIFDSNNNLLVSKNKNYYIPQAFTFDESYQSIDDDVYDNFEEIVVNNVMYGRIEMGFSTEKVEKEINMAWRLGGIIIVIQISLMILFSFFLGVYLTRQLKVLANTSRQVAAGDLNQQVAINTSDEIGEVAHSFNKMIASLKEANERSTLYAAELNDANENLEERVNRRTSKILEQNSKLAIAIEEVRETQKHLGQLEKMASIGQLAAGVAHEINNPVAFIKSNLSTLVQYIRTYHELIEKQQETINSIDIESGPDFKEKMRQMNEYIEDNDIKFVNEDIITLVKESIDGTHRVSEIVQGLKAYSRESDDVMRGFDINQCLDDTLKMLSNELKYACEVVTHWEELPLYSGNKGNLSQVFTNLIVNALQSMVDVGTLTINTALVDENIVVTIADTGKGIMKETMSKLFDPFFTTKAVGVGTGLGLSISQGIVNDHQGEILVESEIGKGAMFTIILPVKA
ncbi:MAG: two-component system NtrC family sensor kinase [Cellvibrionaceae bacterium]|jgi:two-component system NtrC family sensor kinase